MSWKPTRLIAAVFVLLIASCSKPAPEIESKSQQADDAAPSAEQVQDAAAGGSVSTDPAVVDPDHYTVEFENDAVRIVRIKYGPGESSVMHSHPDSVAVFLTDAEGLMTMADGSAMEFSASAGSASFNPAAEHLPKNTLDSAWELVEVEFKSRDGVQGDSGPDPTVVDPDHYTTEFENEDVRIVRIKYGAGEESVMHYHPNSVAVFLTDHRVQMTTPDGTTEEIAASAGDAMFIPGGQHLPRNISESAWELVLIELKRESGNHA